MSWVGILATMWDLLTNSVTRGDSFHMAIALGVKSLPKILKENDGSPSNAELGFNSPILGTAILVTVTPAAVPRFSAASRARAENSCLPALSNDVSYRIE